jgi:hypothetical protein
MPRRGATRAGLRSRIPLTGEEADLPTFVLTFCHIGEAPHFHRLKRVTKYRRAWSEVVARLRSFLLAPQRAQEEAVD